MDEIEQRLKETTEACIKSYEAWRADKKSEEARENLADAIHELRKVSSRLEIEIAISEREQMSGKPIAIPPHRSSRKVHAGEEIYTDGDDDLGNTLDEENDGNNAHGGNAGHGSGQPQRRANNMRGRQGGGAGRGRRPGGGGGGRPNPGNE